MDSILFHFLVLAAVSVIFVPLFRKLKMGSIIGYIFAGVMISPHLTGLLTDTELIHDFSELGLVFLWFFIGLELTPSRLWRLRRWIFGLGLSQVVCTGVIFTAIAQVLGWNLGASYVIGFGLALSSTAFVLQILKEHHQFNTTHGQGAFSILIFQDLAILPILASLTFFTDGQFALPTLHNLFLVVAIILTLVLIEQYVIRHILHLVAESQTYEVFTALSLLLVISAALLFKVIGLSMGMGAFLAGLLLTNSEYRHELEINLTPFKGLLMGVFFISVGMSLDLQVLFGSWYWILPITLGFMIFKGVIIFALGHCFRFPKQSTQNITFTLAQGGEFSFILFNVATSRGIIDLQVSSLFTASVIMSMVITPFLFTLNQRFLPKTMDDSDLKKQDAMQKNDVILAGFGRFGQTVSRVLTRQKIEHTIVEHSSSQVKIARRFKNEVYYGDASRLDILRFIGGDQARIFVLTIDDVEKSLETVKMINQHFPHLKVIARANNRRHAIDLLKLNIKHVYLDFYLSGLEIAKEVLLQKGQKAEDISSGMEKFCKYDEEILKKHVKLTYNEDRFISLTHQVNQDLLRLLEEDEKANQSQEQSG